MSSYISSNDNRLYLAVEPSYGTVPAVAASNRTSFFNFRATHKSVAGKRLDKTGSRSWQGAGSSLRKETEFSVTTYAGGTDGAAEPAFGPLVSAAMGGAVQSSIGLNVAGGSTATTLRFATPHGLTTGQGLATTDEIRFVAGVVDEYAVLLNAPLSVPATAGDPVGTTVTYTLGTELPSLSLFDYWSPSTAVQRIIRGAGVDEMKLTINGDYHQFEFAGVAADVLDSASFESGQGGLADFPVEPDLGSFQFNPIPGHLGQIWIGAQPEKFCTVVEGAIAVNNDLETRNREFGCYHAKALVPGPRTVNFSFSLYEKDDPSVAGLYQAARQRSPISLMLQLGQQAGQLCGVYVKNFVPEVPEFDDSEARLIWKFDSSRAQGSHNDEIYIAFA